LFGKAPEKNNTEGLKSALARLRRTGPSTQQPSPPPSPLASNVNIRKNSICSSIRVPCEIEVPSAKSKPTIAQKNDTTTPPTNSIENLSGTANIGELTPPSPGGAIRNVSMLRFLLLEIGQSFFFAKIFYKLFICCDE